MKNYDYWKSFISTGKIDDYLNYIACTSEVVSDLPDQKEKEGGLIAGIYNSDGNGSVGHAGWRLR